VASGDDTTVLNRDVLEDWAQGLVPLRRIRLNGAVNVVGALSTRSQELASATTWELVNPMTVLNALWLKQAQDLVNARAREQLEPGRPRMEEHW
jgi:hypothetical protein